MLSPWGGCWPVSSSGCSLSTPIRAAAQGMGCVGAPLHSQVPGCVPAPGSPCLTLYDASHGRTGACQLPVPLGLEAVCLGSLCSVSIVVWQCLCSLSLVVWLQLAPGPFLAVPRSFRGQALRATLLTHHTTSAQEGSPTPSHHPNQYRRRRRRCIKHGVSNIQSNSGECRVCGWVEGGKRAVMHAYACHAHGMNDNVAAPSPASACDTEIPQVKAPIPEHARPLLR